MSKRKENEKGFTLIELIMVIVILGIISAVAIPKFLSLSDSAKLSAARGIGGAISGTISAEHSDYLMNGSEYLVVDLLSNTAFAGGISYVSGVGLPAAGTIQESSAEAAIGLNLAGNTYTWTYTALDTDTGTPGFLVEDTSSAFGP